MWPVAVAPNRGPILDDIVIGVDEDANLAWAVELRAEGLQLLADAETGQAILETTRTGTRNFRYLPSTTLPNRWHGYQRVRKGDRILRRGGGRHGRRRTLRLLAPGGRRRPEGPIPGPVPAPSPG